MAQEKEDSHALYEAPASPSRPGSRSSLGAAAAVAAALALVAVSTCWLRLPSTQAGWRGSGSKAARLPADGDGGAALTQFRGGSRALASPASRGSPRLGKGGYPSAMKVMAEAMSIQPIDVPFIQSPSGWRVRGHGISLDALGEPKSGTTWLGRLVPQLALELCGNWNNLWCEMGGLAIIDRLPAPSYESEMIRKNTGGIIDEEMGKRGVGEKTLYLHYKADKKHVIPGMDEHEPERRIRPHPECDKMGLSHKDGFQDLPPCRNGRDQKLTRQSLASCLWSTSELCVQSMTSVDPDVRRSFVIFRDPRDVVISEFRMRTDVAHYRVSVGRYDTLDRFIRVKFETLVSWIHQRWVWHTVGLMAPSSCIVHYEAAQESPLPLIEMANFMGLECSYDQAFRAWKAHENASPHGDYTTHGLPVRTIEYMNATMARLLPPSLALRYGVTPTDL